MAWTYFIPMHDILGGRPRVVSAQPGFGLESGENQQENESAQVGSGLESGESQQEHNSDNTGIDIEDIENVPPGDLNDEDYVLLTPVDEGSSFEEAPRSSSTPSTSNRIHGTSRAAERRRARRSTSGPYQEDLQSILKYMKDSDEQKRHDTEILRQQEREHEMEQTDRLLQAINNVAVAITLSLQGQSMPEQK